MDQRNAHVQDTLISDLLQVLQVLQEDATILEFEIIRVGDGVGGLNDTF